MKLKFTLILLLFLGGTHWWSCTKHNVAYLSTLEPILHGINRDSSIYQSSYLLDSHAIIPYSDLMITLHGKATIAKTSSFNLINEAYARNRMPSYKLENKFVDISFITINDYNSDYAAGDDLIEMLTFHLGIGNEIISKEKILEHFNHTNSYLPFNFDLAIYLKEPPSDTTDFVLKVILKDDVGTYFHGTSIPLIVY